MLPLLFDARTAGWPGTKRFAIVDGAGGPLVIDPAVPWTWENPDISWGGEFGEGEAWSGWLVYDHVIDLGLVQAAVLGVRITGAVDPLAAYATSEDGVTWSAFTIMIGASARPRVVTRYVKFRVVALGENAYLDSFTGFIYGGLVVSTNVDEDLVDEFVLGEQPLAPTVDGDEDPGAIVATSIHLPLAPGNYVIKFLADDAATIWFGTETKAMRMIGSSGLPTAIRFFEFEVFEGETRLDVNIVNVGPAAGMLYMIFSIARQNGQLAYVSTPDGWVWQYDTPVADEVVVPLLDTKLRFQIWTLLPNWKDDITEQLSWQTDVLISERMKEQRRSIRAYPRRTFEANFLRQKEQRARLENFVLGVGRKEFLLPLFHEQYRVQAELASASVDLVIPSLALREFRAGELVMINAGDPNVFDVLEIKAVSLPDNLITWTEPVPRTWPVGSRIFPLRKAFISDSSQMRNPTDRVGDMQVRFQLTEPDEPFEPDWGSDLPIFKAKPNWAEAITVNQDRMDFMLDNQVAKRFVADPSDLSITVERANFVFHQRANVIAMRKFFGMTRGRAVRFYYPSLLHDIVPIGSSIGGSFIQIKPSGLYESMQVNQYARRIVGVVLKNGTTHYRNVVSVQPQDLVGPPNVMTSELIYLEDDLPTIQMSAVSRINWMWPARFEQDTFELAHLTDDSRVVRTSLVIRAVAGDGMPALE